MVNTAVRACTHHWIIEPPNGPVSTGRCGRCGHERTFDNTPVPRHRGEGGSSGDSFRLSARSTHRETIRLSDEH
jgi:hypothetical protein